MHTHTDPIDGAHAEHAAAEARKALPKNRAARRAHGQRGTGLALLGRHTARSVERKLTGFQRAALRAHAKGLRIGYPVRAAVGWGNHGTTWYPTPAMLRHGQAGAPPLEFGERMSNYRLQQAVRTHHVGGTKWRPTPKQRRRLDHKARQAAVRKYREGRREEARFALEHGDAYYAAMSAESAPVARADDPASIRMEEVAEQRRAPMIEQRGGFRVVDRRGEHR